ncbi:unnamed protein product [Peronospora destructor]|uniref:Uncharacterized protein n=1 Tax=Peronospora destructor TaxID=86335 RepID=A0AAV0US46_9STRA|nr:unnamed protein product [Peronospora destructor]
MGIFSFGELHRQKLAQTWRVKPTRADIVRHCRVHSNYHEGVARAQKMHDRTLKEVASNVGTGMWSLMRGSCRDSSPGLRKSRVVKAELTRERIQKPKGLNAYFVTASGPLEGPYSVDRERDDLLLSNISICFESVS